MISADFSYVFPAIRGIQAGREYYVSMCPLRLLSKLFVFDDEELVPELRAQRTLNRARIPDLSRYVLNNRDGYTFSAITASIDGPVKFEPVSNSDTASFRMGTLTVSMESKFVVNDGQHRQAAIKEALKAAPELGDETIAVVFFLDRGLDRCQQMFADLNSHAVRPSASLNILYEHRDSAGNVAKHLGLTSNVFKDVIETERSSLSKRSRKLFTLSALRFSIVEILSEKELEDFSAASKKCQEFWELVDAQIPEWTCVRESKMTAGEVRSKYIHSHAIVLQALGRVGKAVYQLPLGEAPKILRRLGDIDWSRKNAWAWEGRAMIGGSMAKSARSVVLTGNEIKRSLGLALTPEEQEAEDALQASRVEIKGKRNKQK